MPLAPEGRLDTERERLLEKARKARRLARSIAGDPAGQKLLQLAAKYEALAERGEAETSKPEAPSPVAQQQQQPQPEPDKAKE